MASAGRTSPCDHHNHTIIEEKHSEGLTKASDIFSCYSLNIYGKMRARKSEETGLPYDVLFDKVLFLLPFPKICQLRCVCKAWNGMLFSSDFLYQVWQRSSNDGWLVMATKSHELCMRASELVAYIPSLGRWFQFPSYFSPGSVYLRRCGYDASLMASAGGLICRVARCMHQQRSCGNGVLDGVEYTLLVFNPITGSMKELPAIPSSPLVKATTLSMFYDERSNSYKVVVSSAKYGYYRYFLEVYDSETGAWRQVCRKVSAHSDIQDADLFTFHAREEYGREPSWKLEGYHSESNTWSSINVPFSGSVTYEEVVYKFKGRILLVQRFKQPRKAAMLYRNVAQEETHPSGFVIWELKHTDNNTSTLTWEHVASTPPGVLHGDYGSDGAFITNGKLICLTSADASEPPLVYDLVLNSWYLLPCYDRGAGLSGVFSFTPSCTSAV